ncbi:MAG: type II toxin-antitoxin system RelE/ParE family toxin [Deltaproteobacteria bacterium]|nr:type II toxin-antitoxin system RelE/ParE family toxin [Deltaproteobacteria bacterium]
MNVTVSFSPEADEHVEQIESWWRENRDKAPNLFQDELSHAVSVLAMGLDVGRPYRRRGIPGLRRILLPKTRFHVYFVYDRSAGVVLIVEVWGAARGRGPTFKAR